MGCMGWVSPLCFVGSGLRGWVLLLPSGPPRAAHHRKPMAVPPSPGVPPTALPPPLQWALLLGPFMRATCSVIHFL